MKYSPLAVHCASLCFDVIQQASFMTLDHNDIEGFREDVYYLVWERTMMMPAEFERERLFLNYVTEGVISVLHQCLNNPDARDSVWILSALESRIDLSIRTILQ